MPKSKGTPIEIAGVRFSSPDRVIWPDAHITKRQLAEHYLSVLSALLPHLRRRPVTMIRCPDNYHQCFFQKHIDEAAHYEGVTPVWLKEAQGRGLYASVDSAKGLVALVQLGVVEFHTPGIRSDNLTHPDRFILDLDPGPSVGWGQVVEAALALRDILEELGLKAFVKTTGGKGLHVVAPIRRTQTVEQVRAFTQAVATLFEQTAPQHYTTSVSKAKRRGKILIDYLRNAPGATAVEVYAARARAGAPVAVPVTWEELPRIRANAFNVRNLKKRLASLRADPWKDFFKTRQSITVKAKRQVGVS